MSTRPTEETAGEVYRCAECGGERTPETSVKGSYCSIECYHRDKGENILSQIRGDHTLCGTCFKQVKETHRPSDAALIDLGVKWSIRECFVGYQVATPNAADAVDTSYRYKLDADDPDPEAVVPLVDNPLQFGRIGCVCGDVDLRAEDATIRSVLGYDTVAVNLLAALEELASRDAIHDRPDPDAFVDVLDDDPEDFERAVGRSLY